MTSASTFSETNQTSTPVEDVPISAGRAEVDVAPLGERPDLARAIWHGENQEKAADAVVICMFPVALAQIQEHAVSNTSVELGGVLLGHVYHDESRTFVDVRAALPIQTTDHGPIHFTFTADAWSQVHRDRVVRYPALSIIGWFHTHPALGVFFSADDVVVHSAAFTMPWHVGLVVDPVSGEAAFFGWRDSAIEPKPGFYEMAPADDVTVVPWRVVSSEVWQDTYEAHLAGDSRLARKNRASGFWPLSEPWFPLTLGGVALLLAVVLLAGMLINANRRAAVLETINSGYLAAHLSAAESAGLAECPETSLMIMSPLAAESLDAGLVVDVLGRASEPDAYRYLVQTRPVGATDWVELNRFRRSVDTGFLATWDTGLFQSGQYELRLIAVDRDDQMLPLSGGCTIVLQVE